MKLFMLYLAVAEDAGIYNVVFLDFLCAENVMVGAISDAPIMHAVAEKSIRQSHVPIVQEVSAA